MMNVRNPKYSEHGSVECEVEHPVYGWIPFHAVAGDPESDKVLAQIAADALPIASATPIPLAVVKARKIADLDASKARLDRLRYGGTNNGTEFEITDPAIMQELTLGWISIKDNPVGQFTIRDDNGVEVTFTSTALNLALPLITGAKKQISDRYWQRRAVVENANSVAAINAVDAELGRG